MKLVKLIFVRPDNLCMFIYVKFTNNPEITLFYNFQQSDSLLFIFDLQAISTDGYDK